MALWGSIGFEGSLGSQGSIGLIGLHQTSGRFLGLCMALESCVDMLSEASTSAWVILTSYVLLSFQAASYGSNCNNIFAL